MENVELGRLTELEDAMQVKVLLVLRCEVQFVAADDKRRRVPTVARFHFDVARLFRLVMREDVRQRPAAAGSDEPGTIRRCFR